MNRDREAGVVFIFRVPVSALEDFSAPLPSEKISRESDLVIEMLPFSRWNWTEDGKPSAWRRIPDS